MGTTTALLRANPGLLATSIALLIGALVLGTFSLLLARSGSSLRPIAFVGGFFLLVLLPQFAYHLGVATGAIPRRSLTWMPAAERASVYGWVERDDVLAVRDGAFANPASVFGAGVDLSLGSNLRAAGAATPFATAEAAQMVVLPPEGSAIVARFGSAADAAAAAQEYARQALGFWPAIGRDGLRSATRPAGDVAKIALVGRTLVVVTGASERAVARQLPLLGAIKPGEAPSDPGSERYWLYRPGVLPALVFALGALTVFLFFKGAAWAGRTPPLPETPPIPAAELRQRLLSVQAIDVPLTISAEQSGTLVATWRFADARWLDLARAHRIRYVARLKLELDPKTAVVRVTEQQARFDADAGLGMASLQWRATSGITFFQIERAHVLGLQFGADGRPLPAADYAWRFDAQEMKAPLIDAVTRGGWHWQPVLWSGPEWLRWLTD